MKHTRAITVARAESTEEEEDYLTVLYLRILVSLTAVLLSLKS